MSLEKVTPLHKLQSELESVPMAHEAKQHTETYLSGFLGKDGLNQASEPTLLCRNTESRISLHVFYKMTDLFKKPNSQKG